MHHNLQVQHFIKIAKVCLDDDDDDGDDNDN